MCCTIAYMTCNQQQKMHWVPTSIGMLVLMCIFIGITLGAYPGWEVVGGFIDENLKLNLSVNAPAWVQAIGSIGAICAALIVAKNSYENMRKEKKRDALQAKLLHINSVYIALLDFRRAMSYLTRMLDTQSRSRVAATSQRFVGIYDVLKILLSSRHSHEADRYIISAIANVSYTIASIAEIHSDGFRGIKAKKNRAREEQLRGLIRKVAKLRSGIKQQLRAEFGE